MKILFEKYDIEDNKNQLLENWTKVFDNIDDLLVFLKDNASNLLGGYIGKFKLVIRDVEAYKIDE